MDAYLGESKTTSGEVQGPPQFDGEPGYSGESGQILADAVAQPQPDPVQEQTTNSPSYTPPEGGFYGTGYMG
jgi:hypothetical protein